MAEPHDDPKAARGAFVSVMLAILAGVAITVFLIILTGGLFMYVVAFAALMVAFGAFHYVLWGHLFTHLMRDEIEREQLREEQALETRSLPSTPSSTHLRNR